MEIDKEEYARLLAKRAERAVKILKYLMLAAALLAVALGGYSLIAFTAIKDKQATLIGFIVIMAFFIALIIAVISVLAYAYYSIYKLKSIK